jgi:16S rRNA (uracil1498-N3)-methyltransferase
MSPRRFFIPAAEWNPEHLRLTGDELHHCRDVIRCVPGDRVVVFNGAGVEADADLVALEKSEAALRLISILETPRPAAAITLGQAVPKGKNMDLIIQKATELGVSRIVPLLSERSVIRVDDETELGKRQEKWRRTAIEACKQCGQNWIPDVAAPVRVDDFLKKQPSLNSEEELRLVAAISDQARPLHWILEERGFPAIRATVLIGPEGDFTPAEISVAVNAGYHPLSLGPIVLRSETAAIFALSILGYELFR